MILPPYPNEECLDFMKGDLSKSVVRACQLIDVASKTEGIPSNFICFAVARLLREEDIEALIVAHLYTGTTKASHLGTSFMSETLLSLGDKLIDETGVYEDMNAIIDDRLKRWNLSHIDMDAFPETYTPGEQDDEIYARWGHTAEVTAQMVDLLRAHDCALRLKSASQKAPRTVSSKFRL